MKSNHDRLVSAVMSLYSTVEGTLTPDDADETAAYLVATCHITESQAWKVVAEAFENHFLKHEAE